MCIKISVNLLVILVLVSAALADDTARQTAQPAPASVKVRAVRVVEYRRARVPSSEADTQNHLVLYLQFTPPPDFASAVGYGHWQVDQAVDDRGNDIRPEKMPEAQNDGSDARDQADKFKDFTTNREDKEAGADGFCRCPAQLKLALPARSADAVRQVTGHFDITLGGKDHVARFDHPTRMVGQTLADAEMRVAGVSMIFKKPGPKDGPVDSKVVEFIYHGDQSLLHDDMLDIVGSDGKTVVSSWGHSGPLGVKDLPYIFELAHALDDTMTITVTVRTDQKTIRVPFDLRGIQRP